MPFDAKVFSVMIASPSDVTKERDNIREVLAEWNAINAASRRVVLLPLGWETHSSPSMGERPQAIVNKQVLVDADLLVGVFWTRIGTATGEYPSGTVEEIEEHVAKKKPAMLYFSSAPAALDDVEPKQHEELKRFKESCTTRGLLETYSDVGEFRGKFNRQLQLKLNQDDYFAVPKNPASEDAAIPSYVPSLPQLSREAQELLKEATKSQSGIIRRIAAFRGFQIETNGKNFVTDNDARSRALWEGALEELERHHLVAASGYQRSAFRVTREGYQLAEKLHGQRSNGSVTSGESTVTG